MLFDGVTSVFGTLGMAKYALIRFAVLAGCGTDFPYQPLMISQVRDAIGLRGAHSRSWAPRC